MRITIRLPDELLRRARTRANAEGRTLSSLVEEGLVRTLGTELPVSRARGGVHPGIDLTRSCEIEDLL